MVFLFFEKTEFQQGEDDQCEQEQTADAARPCRQCDHAGKIKNRADIEHCENGKQDADQSLAGNHAGAEENAVADDVLFPIGILDAVKEQANQSADHNASIQLHGQINADGKGENGDADQFYGDCNKDTDENQAPRKIAAHDAFNHHFHQSSLRSSKLICSKAPGTIEQIERGADRQCGGDNTDHFADLLFFGRCAQQISGF